MDGKIGKQTLQKNKAPLRRIEFEHTYIYCENLYFLLGNKQKDLHFVVGNMG